MAKQVAIRDLKPGMFIVGVIEQNGPVKIRKSGLVTSHEMVQGLAEMGVLSIAIDPEKTVEIELDDAVHVSQTQFVMQANQEKASKDTDTHLSEQFNRSLFMPSLQKVPSAWQYYGIKVAAVVLVTAAGFTSGWFASQTPDLLNGNVVPVASSSKADTQAQGASNKELAATDSASTEIAVVDEVVTAPIDEQGSDATLTENVANSSSAGSLQSTVNSDSNSQIAATATDTESSEVPNPVSAINADNQVSAELLQRFEKAMADLEKESSPQAEFGDDGETLEYGEQSNDFNNTDVQRVDQLPARVMTRLPKMSFSAHMYASNPNNRWVKVNGIEMGEGEWLDNKVFIERIEPQHVILNFENHQFSMRALSEW